MHNLEVCFAGVEYNQSFLVAIPDGRVAVGVQMQYRIVGKATRLLFAVSGGHMDLRDSRRRSGGLDRPNTAQRIPSDACCRGAGRRDHGGPLPNRSAAPCRAFSPALP